MPRVGQYPEETPIDAVERRLAILEGIVPPAPLSQEVVFADNADTAPIAINSTTDVTIKTTDVTGVVAGDALLVELVGAIHNDSGGVRVFTFTPDFDAQFDPEGTFSILSNATQRMPFRCRWILAVQDSSNSDLWVDVATANANSVAGAYMPDSNIFRRMLWDTVAADLTGTVTVALLCRSNSTSATQEFHVNSFVVRKIAST